MSTAKYQNTTPSNGGNGGTLFGSRRYLRSDAKSAIQRLQLGGVFTEDEIVALVRAAAPLAAKSAQGGRARDYKACMGVIFEAAKLELDGEPQRHEHGHYHIDEERSALIRLARNLGASELEIDGEVIDVPPADRDAPDGAELAGSPSSGDDGQAVDVPAPPSTLGLHADEGGE